MRRMILALLLCPLAVAAADWRYAGAPVAGEPAAMEAATAGTKSPAAGVTATAAPAPADAPRGSMTMTMVKALKGDPDHILDGVGEPPITRWQYPEYVVYFEHDRVITSVAGGW